MDQFSENESQITIKKKETRFQTQFGVWNVCEFAQFMPDKLDYVVVMVCDWQSVNESLEHEVSCEFWTHWYIES